MKTSIIVCRAQNGVIGRDGALPWRLPDDLKYFKAATMGHHLIMGRKTFESLPGILPGRPHIVLSRQDSYEAEGATVVSSLEEALRIAREAGDSEAFIIGGGLIYRQAMSLATYVYLTQVHATVEGDTFFPALDDSQWVIQSWSNHPQDEKHAYSFTMSEYARR